MSTKFEEFVRSTLWLLAFAVFGGLPAAAVAQRDSRATREYPPRMPGAKVEIYKTVGDVRLNAYIFYPPGHQPSDRRPAIIFFFGGGWKSGNPSQFEHHCEYLAKRGMVAITADYRVASRHGVKAVDCVRDAKSAVRWVRQESSRLGIDSHRIAAGGGSAGGHLAAATGVITGLDESDAENQISSRPNALVLFNPALVLAPIKGTPPLAESRVAELRDRMGIEPKELSPYHHVVGGAPPTLILHGEADTTVPYSTAAAFTQAMQKVGNRCELVGYPGVQHGFFNFGRGDKAYYQRTTRRMDEFLASLGYLSGPPTLETK